MIINHPRPSPFPPGVGAKVGKPQTSTRVPNELILPTISVRLLDRLVVFVGREGVQIADADWKRYMEWLRALLLEPRELGVLVTTGPAPTSAQRSLLLQEPKADKLRVAVLISDAKMMAVTRVMSWFMKRTKPFPAHELQKALEHLGESDIVRVRASIRELGGAPPKAAP